MGDSGRHAGGHPDGLRAGIPARDFLGSAENRDAACRRRPRLYRARARGDDFYRRQRAAARRERIDPRVRQLSAGGRRHLRSRNRSRIRLRRGGPPAGGARGAIAVGARSCCSIEREERRSACASRRRSASCSTGSTRFSPRSATSRSSARRRRGGRSSCAIGEALRLGALDLEHLGAELLTDGQAEAAARPPARDRRPEARARAARSR